MIVDALLGTGSSGVPRDPAAHVIKEMEAARAPVIAADIPSGVDASTGEVAGPAVHCVATVAFHRPKLGVWIRPGKEYAGDVEVLTANQCGGGTITMTLDATGENIIEIVLDGTYVGGVLVNSVATPPGGPLVITPAPPIAIAGDGTFDVTFQPITGTR